VYTQTTQIIYILGINSLGTTYTGPFREEVSKNFRRLFGGKAVEKGEVACFERGT
jgi:hypothetical protein